MRKVKLTKGRIAKISDEDHADITQNLWCYNGGGYAVRAGKKPDGSRQTVYMHRQITGAKKGEQVDHIDGDKLNNCRDNLRITTQSSNMQNVQQRNVTGFLGVRPNKKRFCAIISMQRKRIYLGNFITAKEAAKAYDAKALELHGPGARLNFPQSHAVEVKENKGK